MRVQEDRYLSGARLQTTVEELVRLAREGDGPAIVGLLDERVPGATLHEMPPYDMTSIL